MQTLLLTTLRVENFRNLTAVSLSPAPRLNVISGDNGAGKTSLLEAIYFVATSRSFRTVSRAALVRHGEPSAHVVATFQDAGGPAPPLSREQRAGVQGNSAAFRVDGNKPPTAWHYAAHSPVVAFHTAELALSSGPALHRRLLLDRLAFFLDPRAAQHRARYNVALASRQDLLSQPSLTADLATFEHLCALHGAALTQFRAAAADRLRVHFRAFLQSLPGAPLDADLEYAPGGSVDAEVAREELQRSQSRDARRRHAGFGPHRDDLTVILGGHGVRGTASQGQHRLITLGLKAAEIDLVTEARGRHPIVLLDDLSSELDAARTSALLEYFSTRPAQVFLTTTRPGLMTGGALGVGDRADIRLDGGRLTSLTRLTET